MIFISFYFRVVLPDHKIFLCITASAADAAAVNPKGIKTLLANGLITFFINGNPVFSYGARSLPRNPSDCIILDIWVFDNLISIYDLWAKALRRFATFLLVNNNSGGKLILSSESSIIFDNNLKKLLRFHLLFQILIIKLWIR